MRRRITSPVLIIGTLSLGLPFLLAGESRAQEKKAEQAKKAEIAATTPVPRAPDWVKRHEGFVDMARKGNIDLLFLGDSITDAWGGPGHNPKSPGNELFTKEFEPLHAANFGIGGDRTQHVLWRIENGELEGIHPKVVMLMIGTNNTPVDSAADIAAGVTAIVKEIHKRSPQTKILLLGIFPRGPKPNKLRDKIKDVNTIIAKLDDGGKTVKYLDIGDKFVQPDGTISSQIMPDALHLSAQGYKIWADAVKDPILELMGKK
ncbi:MAG TPA: platelet-activating factor acetylhydrolase IB subunit [Gemmataceae bacterium]|nr:platelet-activating factor acetylhydrolase IB subunit [Gemmataceae bacterium]